MLKIASAQVWVHDQDAALAFYTNKVGMSVQSDVTIPEMGNFRWLAVSPADQPDVSIVLMAIPGPPVLMGKGAASGIFLTTDDCRAAYEELKSRGVEFIDEPEERPYGIDAGFRDPSGNHIRLTELKEFPAAG